MKSPNNEKSHAESSMAIIGKNLSALRKSKGVTRATVAYHANISMTTLYKLETGKCGNVGIWALFDLCAYYGVEPNTVLIEGKYAHIDGE